MNLKNCLKKYFGYEEFREKQIQIVKGALKNWDQLRIPLPFSKGIYLWGEKIIDANLFKSEEEFNSKIIKELNENKKIIESYV